MSAENPETKRTAGLPRWLLIAIGIKMVLAVAIVGGVLWWANR
ncbi:MAG: hypothetical protein U1E68_00520 [Sphingomonadaceae bacterium]